MLRHIALFYLLCLVYFSPVLGGKQLVQGDIRNFRGMVQEIVEHRELNDNDPLWTGSMFSGMPAYQISVAWKGDVLKWVDRLFHGFLPHPAGSVFLYLIGMFILLSLMRVDRGVAVVGALAYAFSSYFIIIFEAGHNTKATAIGYMPLVLGATWALFRGAKLPAAALLALFLGLEVHANHLQVTYYLAMVLLLFVLAEALRLPRPGDRLGHVQHAQAELGPRADRDIAYLCGNPNMVDAAFNALKEFGLPVPQIRREKYISSR